MSPSEKHDLGYTILLLIGASVLVAVAFDRLSYPLAIIDTALVGAATTLLHARDR